jgi:hypothetical protein
LRQPQLEEEERKPLPVSVGAFPIKDSYVYLLISVSIVTLAILGYPVYFRSDDIGYFTWVKSHPNFLDCFTPGVNYLFAGHRPITLAYWWVVFNLFGMDQTIYQIVMPVLLILSIVFLHKLSKFLFGVRVGFLTVLVFLLVFNRYFNVLFWYSNVNNLMEPCLAVMGCYFIAHALRTNSLTSKSLAFLFSAGAIFTKEPSMGIISAFSLGLLLGSPHQRWSWRRCFFLVPICAVVVYQLLVTPAWSIRFASRAQASIGGLVDNYLFYTDSLSRGFLGFVLLFLFFYLVISTLCVRLPTAWRGTRSPLWRTPVFFLAMSFFLGLVDTALLHLPFLAGLLAALWLAFRWDRHFLPFLLWFVVVFVFLLALKNQVATNQFDGTFGFAVLLGLSAERVYRDMKEYLPGLLKSRRVLTAGLVAAAVVMVILAGNQIAYQYKALRALKNTRGNFKEVTEFVVSDLPASAQLFLVDYRSLGDAYRREIMKGSLLEKARFHKTMRIEYMEPLLSLLGRPDIRVHPVMEIAEGMKAGSFALPANLRENGFFKRLAWEHSLAAEAVFEVGRGDDSAYVYELNPPPRGSGASPSEGPKLVGE